MAPTSNYTPEQWGGLKLMETPSVNPYAKRPGANLSLMGSNQEASMAPADLSSRFMDNGNLNLGMNTGLAGQAPKLGGEWLKYGEFGIGVANVGISAFNAWEQSKMNDFMKDYYGDLMNLQKADFSNAAKSTNEELAARQGRRLSAQGVLTGTDENKAGVSSYMDQWGVQEKV